jgi:hypothetical protein
MKKTIALLGVVALALTACAENLTPATDETTTESSAISPSTGETQIDPETAVEETGDTDVEDVWLNLFAEHATINAFQFSWASMTGYIENILLERAWNENYRARFGVTCEEAMNKFRLTQQRVTSESEFYATACEVVLAYVDVLEAISSEVNEMINDFTFVRSREHPRGEAWALANEPVFIEMLHHYAITKEEFMREHELLLKRNAEIEDRGVAEFVGHMVFPIEHVDTLFSGDITAIMEAALNPWAIMVEDEVYSAQWLIDHTPDDWADAGLLLEEIEESFEIFSVVLDDAEVAEFEADMEVFEREHRGGSRSNRRGRNNNNRGQGNNSGNQGQGQGNNNANQGQGQNNNPGNQGQGNGNQANNGR